MKFDTLEIVGLPKSFKIYKAIDYLYPKGVNLLPEQVIYDEYPVRCDEENGEDASVVFKYNESSTGVYLLHNAPAQSLALYLSPWAVEADVLLYSDLVNIILQKHPRAKAYEKCVEVSRITESDTERMLSDRKRYLKRQLITAKGFTMEGINHDFTLKVEHLRPASSVDMQVFELQHQFTKMQWEGFDEED